MTTSTGLPLKLLNKGPGYFRERMMSRDSGFERSNRRSAVELLEEMKPLYVKSKSVCETRQSLHGAPTSQMRRSQTSTFTGCGRSAAGAVDGADPCSCAVNQGLQSCGESGDGGHLYPRRLKKSLSHTGASWETDQYDALSNLHVPGEDKLIRDSVDNGNLPDPNALTSCNPGTTSCTHADTEALCHHVKCMEFLSDSSHLKRARYNNNGNVHIVEDMEYNSNKPQGEATTRVRQQEIPTISTPEEWGESLSPGGASSEMDQQSSHSSLTKGDDTNPVIRRRHKKAISRSRSDLTKRCSNSSDLSELSARFSRNSADLEKFFNEMGLDKSVLEPMLSGQCSLAQSTSSLNVFESVSSVSSPDSQSWCSENSQKGGGGGGGGDRGDRGDRTDRGAKSSERALKTLEFEERIPAPTSVVERNARIIKWLCSVKKAGTGPHHDST